VSRARYQTSNFAASAFVHLEEVFMIRSFRKMAVAIAAMGVASGAFAAQATVEFKNFYNTATLTPTDVKQWNATGGVTGTLTFNDTNLPAGKSGLSVDELWLASSIKGTVASKSGAALSASYYKSGFYMEGQKFNYDINYKSNSFKEGATSQFTITGATVASIASKLTENALTSKGVMLEVAGAGKPYAGLFGLGGNLHFIGTVVPEPSTYALMALGLVGIGAVARKRKAA
jgi:PEP-CTERM motif